MDDYGTVLVFPGNGNGTFGSPLASNEGGNEIASFATADFNDDGKVDSALDYGGEYGIVLLGNGDCTFQSPILASVNQSLGNVVAGDFNSDGVPDVLFPGVIYPSAELSVLFSKPFLSLFPFWSLTGGRVKYPTDRDAHERRKRAAFDQQRRFNR
jgi:hypothetical protein